MIPSMFWLTLHSERVSVLMCIVSFIIASYVMVPYFTQRPLKVHKNLFLCN